jgi:hypothetical protein
VIGQQLAEQWPAIVEAAAKPFGGIDELIVLNGAEGLSQTLGQGAAGLQLARSLLSGNGAGLRSRLRRHRTAGSEGEGPVGRRWRRRTEGIEEKAGRRC